MAFARYGTHALSLLTGSAITGAGAYAMHLNKMNSVTERNSLLVKELDEARKNMETVEKEVVEGIVKLNNHFEDEKNNSYLLGATQTIFLEAFVIGTTYLLSRKW